VLSLIFPFYNESGRIHLFIDGLQQYRNPYNLVKEIILVDDGSTDDTLSILYDIKKQFVQYDIKVLSISPNQGKGNAVKTGVLNATQPWILCNDADLSYSLDQIDQWVDKYSLDFAAKNTVYLGSRSLGAENDEMKLFVHRIIIGRIYAFFIRLITGITVKDTQCGYKLYSHDVIEKVFPKIVEKRFAFDVEVHYLLKQNNVDIHILPVKCIDVKGSKVNLFRDSLQMFFSLFRIKARNYK